MTKVTITATATDVAQYNRDMSSLSAAFKPIAAKYQGERGMGPGKDPQKPTLSFDFNDVVSAQRFMTEARAAASQRKFWIGPRVLPGVFAEFKDVTVDQVYLHRNFKITGY